VDYLAEVDLELAFKLIEDNSGVEIVSTTGVGRVEQDVKEALRNVLEKHVDMLYELGEIGAVVSK